MRSESRVLPSTDNPIDFSVVDGKCRRRCCKRSTTPGKTFGGRPNLTYKRLALPFT
jgi:hypothetical protein